MTNPGTTGTSLGNGIGITQTAGGNEVMGLNEGISVSAVTVSNVNFTGTLTDPNYTFTPGGVSGLRHARAFAPTISPKPRRPGAHDGPGTIGFGTATGTIASNLVVDNNLASQQPVPAPGRRLHA